MSREVEEIKAKLDLVDFISEYIKLLPAGANFKAPCPFHNEKTPSLMVNRSRQIWKCFGCGEGGDIFSFLMKMEGLDFAEALKVLAQRTGVVLNLKQPEFNSPKNRLYDLCDLASRYWQKVLQESPLAEQARSYLAQRGLSAETMEDFRLGYAVESWDNLILFLSKKGFSYEEVFSAGLSVRKDRGSGFYDRFRDRIMFPIFDVQNRVVGFGGRTLRAEESAKYINTPQTEIYNKSAVLYGLSRAKEAIKHNNLIILVEGYMDVLPSYQAGVKNVAAISGTALTLEQIKILKRYSNNLALALDMDAAGRQAALRSIDLALAEEMNVRVISLPFGKDPGECIKNNPADWQESIEKAEPIMEYFFSQAIKENNLSQPLGKKQAAKFLLEKISRLGNKVEQDYWLKQLASLLSISEMVLREILPSSKPAGGKSSKATAPEKIEAKKSSEDQETNLIKRIIVIISNFPKTMPVLVDAVPLEVWQNKLALDLYKKIVLFYTRNKASIDGLSGDNPADDFWRLWEQEATKWEELSENEAVLLEDVFLMSQAAVGESEEAEARSELENYIKSLRKNWLGREIDELKVALEKMERSNQERSEMDAVYEKLNELVQEKAKLS